MASPSDANCHPAHNPLPANGCFLANAIAPSLLRLVKRKMPGASAGHFVGIALSDQVFGSQVILPSGPFFHSYMM
jgi:hypothetical protein